MTYHTTPECNRNWVSFAHGLIKDFAPSSLEIEHFYSKVSAAVKAWPGAGPCACTFVSQGGDQTNIMTHVHGTRLTSSRVITIETHQTGNKVFHHPWTDPIQGRWEIAKIFLPDLGEHAITSAEDIDLTGILNLMYWCDHFRPIPQPLIKDLRDIRNRVWGHVTKLELTNAEKAIAFGAIEALLQHPSLAHDRDAQKALHEIQLLKTVTDVDNFQAQVLKQVKEMIEEDILGLLSRITLKRVILHKTGKIYNNWKNGCASLRT